MEFESCYERLLSGLSTDLLSYSLLFIISFDIANPCPRCQLKLDMFEVLLAPSTDMEDLT